MKKKSNAALSQEDLEELLAGKKDKTQLKHTMKQISQTLKLQSEGVSQEEISSSLWKDQTQDEIERSLVLYKFIIDNKELFADILGDNKKKTQKIRQSGHLTDQTLKYRDPNQNQLTIFDLISPETKEKIETSAVEVKAEGIRLSAAEDKLLKALNKLLHEKSENRDIHSDAFYAGNESHHGLSPYGGRGQEAKAPILRIFPTELYTAYLDRNDYSGEEIKFIKKLLNTLSQKKFLIVYDRRRKENGKEVTDRIEDFQSLVKIMSYIEGLSDSDLKKLDSGDLEIREKRGELIIGLNPIFVDQINTKYIEYPSDINKRTTIAAGGHRFVTESVVIMRDYMLREMSAKRFRIEINEERLTYLLRLDNYIKDRKKKIVAERIANAITTVKNLGIILEVEKMKGMSGQTKYVFVLNKEFE